METVEPTEPKRAFARERPIERRMLSRRSVARSAATSSNTSNHATRINKSTTATHGSSGWCHSFLVLYFVASLGFGLYCYWYSVSHSPKSWTQFVPPSLGGSLGTSISTLPSSPYAAALATLRCLTTPRCFPTSACRSGGIPQKIRRKKKWEEHSFCVNELLALPSSSKPTAKDENNGTTSIRSSKSNVAESPCLVYSFGIHESYEWEEKVARLFHCEVHAFDPTMDHPTQLAPGVTFHKLGLQGEGTDMSATHAVDYQPIDPSRLLSLRQIMQRLQHVGRTIHVLALDCEGCEWGALQQLACGSSSSGSNTADSESTLVDQLFVEFHFQKNLGLSSEMDVVQAARGIDCLWDQRWHVVAMERSGSSWKDWDYTHDVTQVIQDAGFLLYMAFQRIPVEQDRPSDRFRAAIQASKVRFQTEDNFLTQFKTDDKGKWSTNARTTMHQLTQAESQAYAVYNQLHRPMEKLQFDEFSRVPETR